MNAIPNTETAIQSYLTFHLGTERFAISVSQVFEILEIPKMTKVPQAPAYMKGVINLRGNVLPVIDTHIKFGMPPTEFTVSTCIVVLNVMIEEEKVMVGVLVDSVDEVIEIDSEKINPSPSIGNKYKSEFITGMVKVGDDFLMILNVDKVLDSDDLSILDESTEQAVINNEA